MDMYTRHRPFPITLRSDRKLQALLSLITREIKEQLEAQDRPMVLRDDDLAFVVWCNGGYSTLTPPTLARHSWASYLALRPSVAVRRHCWSRTVDVSCIPHNVLLLFTLTQDMLYVQLQTRDDEEMSDGITVPVTTSGLSSAALGGASPQHFASSPSVRHKHDLDTSGQARYPFKVTCLCARATACGCTFSVVQCGGSVGVKVRAFAEEGHSLRHCTGRSCDAGAPAAAVRTC